MSGSSRLVPRGAAGRRPGRSHRDPEDPAAQVLLRRARQRAVRPDNPPAGVLPHPGRGLDPDSSGPPRSPSCRSASRSWSSAAAPPPRPGCCYARCSTAAPCASSCRSIVDPTVLAESRARRSPPSTQGCGSGRSSVTSSRTSPRYRRRPPHDRVPRLHDRQPRSAGASELPQAGRRRTGTGGHVPARDRPGQGRRPTAACLR